MGTEKSYECWHRFGWLDACHQIYSHVIHCGFTQYNVCNTGIAQAEQRWGKRIPSVTIIILAVMRHMRQWVSMCVTINAYCLGTNSRSSHKFNMVVALLALLPEWEPRIGSSYFIKWAFGRVWQRLAADASIPLKACNNVWLWIGI